MISIALGQFADDANHGRLHALVERVVVNAQAAGSAVPLIPGSPLMIDQLQARRIARRAAQQLFDLRQRGVELHRRRELQVLPVEEAQQQLQRVLA
jgi:hypothetical protein